MGTRLRETEMEPRRPTVRAVGARAAAAALVRAGAPLRAAATEATRLERAVAALTSPSAAGYSAAMLAAIAALPTELEPGGEGPPEAPAAAAVAIALAAAQRTAAAPRARRPAAPRAPPPPANPRGDLRAAFAATLGRCAAADPARYTQAPALEVVAAAAAALETACYNATVTACIHAEDPPRRQWDSPAFVDVYSARCGVVLSALDPDGPCAAFESCKGLAQRLLDTAHGRPQQISPAALALATSLGARSAAELCPEALANERAEIEQRLAQHIEVSVDTRFPCPHCHARRCTVVEVQRRSADEGRDIDCTCLECGLPFRGA